MILSYSNPRTGGKVRMPVLPVGWLLRRVSHLTVVHLPVVEVFLDQLAEFFGVGRGLAFEKLALEMADAQLVVGGQDANNHVLVGDRSVFGERADLGEAGVLDLA